jgi:hypothetical protein
MNITANAVKSLVTDYKKMMDVLKAGGDPPCIRCGDNQIFLCAVTGYSCRKFRRYLRAGVS